MEPVSTLSVVMLAALLFSVSIFVFIVLRIKQKLNLKKYKEIENKEEREEIMRRDFKDFKMKNGNLFFAGGCTIIFSIIICLFFLWKLLYWISLNIHLLLTNYV